jgi:hypothetical protein
VGEIWDFLWLIDNDGQPAQQSSIIVFLALCLICKTKYGTDRLISFLPMGVKFYLTVYDDEMTMKLKHFLVK